LTLNFHFSIYLGTQAVQPPKTHTRVIPNPAAFSRRVRNLLFNSRSNVISVV
jgi:hypothetical protein